MTGDSERLDIAAEDLKCESRLGNDEVIIVNFGILRQDREKKNC